jgi:CMP-N-acetylneuraminic acid synthetase
MSERCHVLVVIPARGGSKGVLRKNLRVLAEQPLLAHTIRAARGAACVSHCVVSTEDKEIAEMGRAHGAEVIQRPAELATDSARSEAVVRHSLDSLMQRGMLVEHVVLLQPTSPLRNACHVQNCVEAYLNQGHGSAMSVVAAEHHPYKMLRQAGLHVTPLFDVDSLSVPRQLLPPVYRQNGAIYVAGAADFLRLGTFFIPPVLPFVMNAEDSVDIDTESDLEYAAWLMKRRP